MSRLLLDDGGHLFYEVHGDGPPLMLAAGLAGLGSFWTPHLEALAAHFTVVVHDHRGTGRSSHDPIDYSIAQMAGDVLALMDGLGLERVHFVGHSTGGAIGQHLALEHPARLERMVLSATWPGPDPYITALFELRAEILERAGANVYERLGALLTVPPQWTRDHGAPGPRAARLPAADVAVILSRIRALLRFDRAADLHAVDLPVLVICARDDVVIPAYCSDALAQAIAGARLQTLAHGGHFAPRTRPAAWREHVLAFLLAR